MDKYLTFPGLQPVYLGDIDFLQESTQKAWSLFLKGLTGQEQPNCILVKPTAEADGAICIAGEILPYKYKDVGSGFAPNGYKIVSDYSGSRQFANGETHSCYEMRHVEGALVGDDSPYHSRKFIDLQKVLITRGKVDGGYISNGSSEIPVKIGYFPLAQNRCEVKIEISISAEVGTQTYEKIIDNMGSAVPGEYAGTYYTTITFDTAGELKLLPARIDCEYDGVYSCKMTVTIPSTSLPSGSKGYITFTITK